MNVSQVIFEKRNSGITWISLKDESGAIEVYPLNSRATEALRNFLNDPISRELTVKDNFPPKTEKAFDCKHHGRYYSWENHCPACNPE